MKPLRLLFHCQHLLGVGHLSRSLALARGFLDNGWQVDFLQGGPDIGRKIDHAAFRFLTLPPLLMEEETSELYDPSRKRSPEEIFADRKIALEKLLDENSYDAFLTELYPFGRGKFKKEYLFLLEKIRERNPQALRVSSVRDILVEKADSEKRDRKAAETINTHYDFALVHSDPELFKLDETFRSAQEIKDRTVYTGYVTEKEGSHQERPRKPQVLVSFGGGIVGDELAVAVAEASRLLPELHFRVVQGPYMPENIKAHLQQAVQSQKNLELVGFLSDFEDQLAESCLSLSMAGYNTVMNLLSTRTPALVYPYDANHEQEMRARRLEEKNWLGLLSKEDLDPTRLAERIRKHLQAPRPDGSLNLKGASTSAKFLREKIEARS